MLNLSFAQEMTTRKDEKEKEKKRRSTERVYGEHLLWDQSVKIKCQWGDAAFMPRQKIKRTVPAQMHVSRLVCSVNKHQHG